MHSIDLLILVSTLLFIVLYGIYKTRKSNNVEDYIRGGNESHWWTIGLSVMATQASAITFLSTPGQAFHSGMGFVQFYFGLPIAMIIICMVFIPIYHRLKVYTAYEYLEGRFDLKTRTLTALLFLTQRGLSAGITIFAPAIILSAVMGWQLTPLCIIIGSLVTLYTVSGGTKAVNVTQKQQMAVIFIGMFAAFFIIINSLPKDISFTNALEIAGINGKLEVLNFSFDFENRYTVWSGLIGGTFLALSYFGTDQSQVQRYLSGKSVRESQLGLLFNGMLKIPMQFFILLIGVMVFVFYQFNPSPLNFNPTAESAVLHSSHKTAYIELEDQLHRLQEQKEITAYNYIAAQENNQQEIKQAHKAKLAILHKKTSELRKKAAQLIHTTNSEVETNDTDYVFIYFILNNLPRGVIGLLLAVILCAAMSSTAAELNALASTTTIDLYKRNVKVARSKAQEVKITKWFTVAWGIIAISVACVADLFENLIQLVNIIGSIFYGNVLGIFLLAFFVKFVQGKATFIAAIITQIIVLFGYFLDWMPYLWLNLFGCAVVMGIAILLQLFFFNFTKNKLETS